MMAKKAKKKVVKKPVKKKVVKKDKSLNAKFEKYAAKKKAQNSIFGKLKKMISKKKVEKKKDTKEKSTKKVENKPIKKVSAKKESLLVKWKNFISKKKTDVKDKSEAAKRDKNIKGISDKIKKDEKLESNHVGVLNPVTINEYLDRPFQEVIDSIDDDKSSYSNQDIDLLHEYERKYFFKLTPLCFEECLMHALNDIYFCYLIS